MCANWRCGATHRIPAPAPCITYSGEWKGLDVHIVWNGRDGEHGVDLIGTVPAAISSYLALQAFKPDLLISAGTAGGFKCQVLGCWWCACTMRVHAGACSAELSVGTDIVDTRND
jgi:hypothetical protein